MRMPAAKTKIVAEFTMVCDDPNCRRTIGAQPSNLPNTTRFTTCKRHRPATGYVVQVLARDAS